MPRDRDEDVSSLSGAPSSTAKPPAPPAPIAPPPVSLAWGVCGVLNLPGELASTPGRTGVVRYVNNGVEYTAPPLSAIWRKAPDDGAGFEMVWEGDPARARSLVHLQKELDALKRASGAGDHPLLRQLDSVAMNLASIASTLNEAGWGLGLLRPENVLIRPRGGESETVLVDLGFTWRGTFGPPPWKDSPGRPDWLVDGGPYSWLWDREPDKQQFAAPTGAPFPPPGPVADVRLLGRLFAWLITGQPARELRPLSGNNIPDCWPVLCDAVAGRIPTASDLASRLSSASLSKHVVPPPLVSTTPIRQRRWRVLILIALVVAGGAGAAIYLQNPEPELVNNNLPTTPTPKVEPPPQSTPKADDFNLFDDALKSGDLKKALDHLKALLKSASKERAAEVEAKRQLALGEWMKAYEKANLDAQQPSERYRAAQAMAALSEEWKSLSDAHPSNNLQQREREKQCLDFVLLRARELGAER